MRSSRNAPSASGRPGSSSRLACVAETIPGVQAVGSIVTPPPPPRESAWIRCAYHLGTLRPHAIGFFEDLNQLVSAQNCIREKPLAAPPKLSPAPGLFHDALGRAFRALAGSALEPASCAMRRHATATAVHCLGGCCKGCVCGYVKTTACLCVWQNEKK